LPLNLEVAFGEQPADSLWVKVKIEGGKFYLLRRKGIPGLFSPEVTEYRFEVAFIGKLQDENGILSQYATDTLQG